MPSHTASNESQPLLAKATHNHNEQTSADVDVEGFNAGGQLSPSSSFNFDALGQGPVTDRLSHIPIDSSTKKGIVWSIFWDSVPGKEVIGVKQ